MKYDFVCSLGQWCATAIVLRKLGLRSCSGPFDWLLGRNVDLAVYIDLIRQSFENLLPEFSLCQIGADKAEGHVHYRCERTGLAFLHDFTIGRPFVVEYPEVCEKYRRRMSRLLKMLASGSRVLMVHFRGEGHYQSKHLASVLESLRVRFPRSEVDLLVLECEKGARKVQEEELVPGLVRVVGDFYDHDCYDAVCGNERLLLRVLGRIRLRNRWRNRFRTWMLSCRRRFERALRDRR